MVNIFSYPIRNESFLLCIESGKNEIHIHPGSDISVVEQNDFRIFVRSDHFPIAIKTAFWNDIHTFCPDSFKSNITENLTKLEGDFVLIILDRGQRKIIMARDRLGKKCLYYAFHDDWLIISDVVENIIDQAPALTCISSRAVDLFLGLGFIPSPLTVYESIKKIPAGFWVSISNGDVETASYIEFFTAESSKSEHQLTEELHRLLKQAVSSGLDPELPVPILFSGGIDSSLIAHMAVRKSRSEVTTWYIGQPGSDESREAAQTAAEVGGQYREISLILPPWQKLLELFGILNEPAADTMLIPLSLALEQLSAEKIYTSAWTGIGADDLFGGLYEHVALELWRRGVNRHENRPLYPDDQKSDHVVRSMLKKLYSENDRVSGWIKLVSRLSEKDRRELTGSQVRERLPSPTREFLQDWIDAAPDFIHGASRFAARIRLPDLTMRVVGASCDFNQLEHFSPFTVDKVAAFSACPSAHSLFRNMRGKGVVRSLFYRVFPGKFQQLRQRGFSISRVDLLLFYQDEFDRLLREYRCDYLDNSLVCRWWELFKQADNSRKHQYAGKLWPVMAWMLWDQARRFHGN